MNHVSQLHKNGCAPASIAMLANISYKKSCSLFPRKRQWENYGTKLNQVLYILSYLGFNFQEVKNLGKRSALVILKLDDEGFHAVVWNGEKQKIFDPQVGKYLKRHHTLFFYKKRLFKIFSFT